MSKQRMTTPTDDDIRKAAEALNNAPVPLENRYFVDDTGQLHGPITITKSENVPVDNNSSDIKIHKVE